MRTILLGVNIDHIATIREARGTSYPDPVKAALDAEEAGADGITLHMREDRRHIQPRDVHLLKSLLQTRMNLELAITPAMLDFALDIHPEHACLVPEKREELTTEGGLDVAHHHKAVSDAVKVLTAQQIEVSLFIDPDLTQIDAALATGAPTIELHTGCYADAKNPQSQRQELERLIHASHYASQQGLIVNAGHGLHYHNVKAVAAIKEVNELNIGHAVISRALFVGLKTAITEMRALMLEARQL